MPSSDSSPRRTRFQKKLELLLEAGLWRFRLIAIVPVVMSLASTLLTFAIGTRDIARSIQAYLTHAHDDHGDHLALAGVVSGIDFYLIGVALLIFGYGIYELLISEIDVYLDQADMGESGGLLDIRNLDQLKEKLVKVLVVALIVSAFKSMISIPVKRLINSAKQIGKGEVNALTTLETGGEFGELATVLNCMVDDLQAQTRQLERQSSERQELVLNMLPASIASRLLNGEETIADQVENVSVMFSNVIGFRELSRSMSSSQMVESLNDLVCRFDGVTEQFGIEKIKTSGDDYIATCGLSVARLDHMNRMVDFALELQAQVKRFNYDHGSALDVVSSIHAGDVVAGIVGSKKMIYDIWGETVTIANGILAQSHATRGSILVSEPVQSFLKDLYGFEKLEPRSGGERFIPVWRLTGVARTPLEG